jgi:sRNA-binding protein
MEIRESKSQKARDSANIRWNKNANAMQTQCDSNASKGKESKGKEKKGKEKKVNKNKCEIIKASNDILELHPKQGLKIKAQTEVYNAIIREIENGKTLEDSINMIKFATIEYSMEFKDDSKFAKNAVDWYSGGGYLSVVKKPKVSKMREF